MKLRLTLAAAALLAVGTASAQTADEIVKKHIEAVGGADAWKKVNSIKRIGTVNANGMDIPVTIQTLNGKGMRMDLEIMGSKNFQILTTKDGWVFFPVSQQVKPEPMTAEQVAASQSQLDVQDNLTGYASQGSKIELVGKEDIDGTECFKIKITRKDGQVITDYVDPKSFYILRTTQKVKADGKEQEMTMNFGNYQKLPEGIVVPMMLDGGQGAVTVKTVEVNTIKDESIFKPDTKG